MECKFSLDLESFNIALAYSHHMTPRATKQIRRIICSHFDYFVEQWQDSIEETIMSKPPEVDLVAEGQRR